METKQDIRKKLLLTRDSLTGEERQSNSRKLQENLLNLPEYQAADLIFNYCAFRSEADTREIALHTIKQGKALCYPCIETVSDGRKSMEFYRVLTLDDLEPGTWGIPEPLTNPINKIHPKDWRFHRCFMVVPGCGFDYNGYRIGYGKGFYDRYLHRFPWLYTAGLCFSVQLTTELIHEPHDVSVKIIVTEKDIIRP